MSREVHVRFCERLGVQLPGPTHLIVLNETGLRRILKSYFDYYENFRTHLSLNKDAPAGRVLEPLGIGRVIEIPQVGGLHHLYTRKAA